MKKTLFTLALLGIVLTLVINQISFSQITQEWAARYNGPDDSTDYGFSVASDDSGNVYAAGASFSLGTSYNYVTIKYNSIGEQKWAAIYNNGDDAVYSVAVDDSGNVYVTGWSTGFGTNTDCATIKYNSAGVQQWVTRYNGPANRNDFARKVAVDRSGNVYITGQSYNQYYSDFITIKYNSSGVEQWVALYDGPGNLYDDASSLKVDSAGNVYVSGSSSGGGSFTDYATIKYNASGVQQWVARYNGTANLNDYNRAIDIDRSGNIYITGYSEDSSYFTDYATIKYNMLGEQQWVARYNGTGNSNNYAISIATDSSGNVYVTGQSYGNGTNVDYATIKYDSSGTEQWVARYNGSGNSVDNAVAVALDGLGNIYVTGNSTETGTSSDYTTIKYNPKGAEQWIAKYNGAANSNDAAFSISVNPLGNVFVTGISTGNGTGLDIATVSYSQSSEINQISSIIPEKFSLSQNYPNPFNPSTVIIYQLTVSSFTKLVVYDVTGKEVATLVNEQLSPGNYKVEFDGSNLTSGVYFYKIQTENFTDTKRMMLLK